MAGQSIHTARKLRGKQYVFSFSAFALLFLLGSSPQHEVPIDGQFVQRVGASDAEIRLQIEREAFGSSKMFLAMKNRFPDEYEALLVQAIDGYKRGSGTTELSQMAMQFTIDLRRRNMQNFAAAPSEGHRQYMKKMVSLFDHLQQQYGAEACNAMAGGGAAAMAQVLGDKLYQDETLLGYLDELGGIYLDAAADGLATPIQRSPPTQEDWASLLHDLNAAGVEQSEIALVLDSNVEKSVSDPRYCDAHKHWFQVMTTIRGPEAERILALIVSFAAGV